MRESLKTGLSFGFASGVITTLGLMVGLNSGTGSKAAVLGGILTIAVADSFSDALGIHISQEAQNRHEARHVWEATVATFLAKFFFALTFAVPVLLLPLGAAITASVVYGLTLLAILSYFMGRQQGVNPLGVIFEHLLIAAVVIVITYAVGEWIKAAFGEAA